MPHLGVDFSKWFNGGLVREVLAGAAIFIEIPFADEYNF
jgi:hypothetical protein